MKNSAPFEASSMRPIRLGDHAGGPDRSSSTICSHGVSA
jgi:hypothetical protein